MKKENKNKLCISQRIRMRRATKRLRKSMGKKKKGKKGKPSSVAIPSRRFRRTSSSNIQKKNTYYGRNLLLKKSDQIHKFLPVNLRYLTLNGDSPLNLRSIAKESFSSNGEIQIPEYFSILDYPQESYLTLRKIISALLIESNIKVILNYENCKKVELSTQVLLDIILKDFWIFSKKCKLSNRNKLNLFPITIGGKNINDEEIQKMLFSVGSPAILGIKEDIFDDIIKYKLCIHENEKEKNLCRRIEQKEIDTTEMAEYVVECLKRMNKKLTGEKLNDLCTVIGEILINAEEHSTTKYRFSIGYFKEETREGNHFGIFRLVILNFGKTIYEKFKSEDCPNKDIVIKMSQLSKSYTKRNLFRQSSFEEENLWTLYALQEGVTSISYEKYKRGNGSIRFIESFFNIKGSNEVDNTSRLSIISGKTRIIFDGKYNIVSKTNRIKETFKVMTFNDSGNIYDKPDSKYVYCTEDYFPGTLISAKILLNDDDLKQIKK